MGSPHASLVHEITPAFQDPSQLDPLHSVGHAQPWWSQSHRSGTTRVFSTPLQCRRNFLRFNLPGYVCSSPLWISCPSTAPSVVAPDCGGLRILNDVALCHALD